MTTASHPLVGTVSPHVIVAVPTTIWAMRQAARATHERSLLRVSALCVGIAIAVTGCTPPAPPKPTHHECVDIRNGETFRFMSSDVQIGGLFSRKALIKDEQGFQRIVNESDLKCRELAQ